MKVLVIGSGGREHALAWKLAQSGKVQTVFVAPGNGGTAADPKLTNIALTDFNALADFVQAEKVTLTVVGPEAPLAGGIVDVFRARGLRVFGPTRAAAQLESSKAFAKAFMQRHAIPTASFGTFTDAAQAHAHVDAEVGQSGAPIVVKAALEAAGLKPDMAEVTMRAENTVALAGDDAQRMQKLLDVIEELDDTQEVFHNAEIRE